MKWRRPSIVMVIVLVAAAGISAPTAGQTPDQVIIGRGAEVPMLDPQRSLGFPVLVNIFDTLIAKDASLQLQPGLATSWRTVNPTTWELTLRRGVRFHNGEPFNANVVKYSLERALDPKTKNPRAGLLRLIKDVRVVNEYQVQVTTEQPWPTFPHTVATFGYIVPPQYIQREGEEVLARHPIGTGPYRFVRWVKDDRLELEAYDSYWGGRPRIRRAVFRPIPSNSTRLAGVLSGSVHMIDLIPPELYGPIERSARAKLVQAPSLSILWVLYNLVNIPPNRPLADKRVRVALNYAIDRQLLVNSIMHNIGTPVATFCTEASADCDKTVQPFPYDPQRAQNLLREAGYPDGFDMTIAATSGAYPGDRDLALAVADQLNAVGVRARVVITEYGLFINNLIRKQVPQDAVFVRFTDFTGYAGSIPMRAFHPEGGATLYVPGNPQLRELLESAEVTLDERARQELYRRAQLLFKEEAPAIPLITAPIVHGMHRDLNWPARPDLLISVFEASWNRR